MPSSVWLITTGSYSDYRVLLACATRELADAYAVAKNERITKDPDDPLAAWDIVEVEEVTLIDAMPGPEKIVWQAYAFIQDQQIQAQGTTSYMIPEWQEMPMWEGDLALYGSGTRYEISGPEREHVECLLKEWVAKELATQHSLASAAASRKNHLQA